ncbi:hypothetical protein D3C87_2113150 [compost metagenome]
MAVREMIGVRARPRSRSRARIAAVAAKPSITGICVSIRIRSNGCSAKAVRAAWPSAAMVRSAASPSIRSTTF